MVTKGGALTQIVIVPPDKRVVRPVDIDVIVLIQTVSELDV